MFTEDFDALGVNLPDIDLENFAEPQDIETDDEDSEEIKEGSNEIPDNDQVEENEEGTETYDVSEQLINITSEWMDKGLIPFDEDSIPDEFKEGFGMEEFLKLVELSLEKTKEDTKVEAQKNTFEKVVGSMPEILQRTFEYSLNGVEETDVKDYMRSLLYEQDIKDLDPTKSEDAEKIVSEWLKDQGLDAAKREARITKLKERGDLEDEAQTFKPQLDLKAEAIAQEKVQFQNNIKKAEQDRKEDLDQRIRGIFEKNTKNGLIEIKGIPVDRELAGFLHHALVNDEVPATIGGKNVDLTVSEAIVLYHKYNKGGDLENLMRALVLLHQPDKFDEVYSKKAQKVEAEKFIKDHKFSAQKKAGNVFSKKTEESSTPKMKLF